MRRVVVCVALVVSTVAGCSQTASASSRPTWNGHGFYPANGVQPLCPRSDAGHYARVGRGRHSFRVRCDPAGNGVYVWDAV